MVGGLLQLKEKGPQDIYLTGNPQITFFKIVYRRHTNFSIESIVQTWQTMPTSDALTTSCIIGRKGDLIHKMYIQEQISKNKSLNASLTKNYGYDHIEKVNIQIGSQIIDEHTNNWMETYAELTQKNEYGNFTTGMNALCMNDFDQNGTGLTNASATPATRFQSLTMAGGVDSLDQKLYNDNKYKDFKDKNSFQYIYIPLQFWFCRNIGLALPLIALQYNEVIFNITFKSLDSVVQPELYIDYIFLDTDERRRFAQISHEYLFEQVQMKVSSPGLTHNLNFKNPVKEIIWVSASSSVNTADYGDSLVGEWVLKINGYDRFTYRDISYFTKQQVYDYHTGYGGVTERNSIAVYSFSLHPEDHQPSGTMNFSNIQHCYLVCKQRVGDKVQTSEQTIIVYAINYNILRILAGQGNLAYSS